MKKDSGLRLLPILAAVALLLLVAKYFWTLVVFPGVPFGYDAGIYRYLFIREATGLPPFIVPDLPEWAKTHAPGLFFFSSILVNLGVSPDLLIGWSWNLAPVLLSVLLAHFVRRRHGDLAGFFTLVVALVSVVQLQGFLMIYMKVFVALAWCAAAFFAFEAGSILWVPLGMMTIATHQQIGLVYVLAMFCAVRPWRVVSDRTSLRQSGLWLLSCVLGALWYLPTYQRSIADHLPALVQSGTLALAAVALMAVGIFSALFVAFSKKHRRGLWILCGLLGAAFVIALPMVSDAPDLFIRALSSAHSAPGAFLDLTEYIRLSWPLLLLGVFGFTFSTSRDRGSPWQWAVLWCAVAVIGMFFFYRRFILPLDFFLLPFAGIACAALWTDRRTRIAAAGLLLVQAWLTVVHLRAADPHVERAWLAQFADLPSIVPAGSTVVVLDNMAPWVLGYLPDASVSGPGIFDSRPYEEWEKLLLGSDADRRTFIATYPKGTFFYATDVFLTYYPDEVQSLLRHHCLKETTHRGLYQSVCGR